MVLEFRDQAAINVAHHIEQFEGQQEHRCDVLPSKPDVGVREMVG